MVRLLRKENREAWSRLVVSIPQWCDCCTEFFQLVEFFQEFQSHNGAIAALRFTITLFVQCSFNPTMVRLLLLSFASPPYFLLFQSHNGAIAAWEPATGK